MVLPVTSLRGGGCESFGSGGGGGLPPGPPGGGPPACCAVASVAAPSPASSVAAPAPAASAPKNFRRSVAGALLSGSGGCSVLVMCPPGFVVNVNESGLR